VRLLSEVVGALGAGALVFVIARQTGISSRRAFGAIALVPVSVAVLLAMPALNDGRAELSNERRENDSLTAEEAQVITGHETGISTEFFSWVGEHLAGDDTFHLEVGRIPDEVFVKGVGVRQAAILQWGLYQLAPNLAFEQSPKARDLKPGEGRHADWLVFYESSPAKYPGPLGKVITYAPDFAIARSRLAD
jgi:hypothetical protein